ncbi:MAG: metalloregulator ArsR/SmtB family transcription factor [Pseudomonadota bacterium]
MLNDLPNHVARLKAAADPTRLRLLNICFHGEFTVTELTRILGYSQPRVSRHLRTLVDAGLLMRFREQHFVFYRVPRDVGTRDVVHAWLSGLNSEDATLQQDRAAVSRVRAEREERARNVLAEVGDEARIEPYFSTVVGETIRSCLDLDALGNLLDIGTGSGRVLRLLAPHVVSAVGIDISSDMLAVARSNLAASAFGNVMVRQGDMYRLPFADGAFDTVTLDNVLGDAKAPARALAEVARTLRPGGVMLVIESERPTRMARPNLERLLAGLKLNLEHEAHVVDTNSALHVYLVTINEDALAA